MQSLHPLLRAHSATLRDRGVEYQRAGRVRIVRSTPIRIEALVQGTREYRVVLQLVARDWIHTCTCPAHDDFGQCKHVCAVLSELLLAGVAARDDAAGARAASDAGLASGGEPERVTLAADIQRLLAASWIPADFRQQLLHSLIDPHSARSAGERREPEAQRARRLLQVLEQTAPALAAPAPRLTLRYILSPLPASPGAAGLEVQAARILSRGNLGSPRPLDRAPDERELDELDRRSLAVLSGAPREAWSPYAFVRRSTPFALQPALQRLLLPDLARAGRLYLRTGTPATLAPAALDAGPSWSFGLDVDLSRDGLELEGALERAGERLPMSEVAFALGGGFAVVRGELRSVDWHGAHAWAAQLCATEKLRVPSRQRTDLVRTLARAPVELPLRAAGLVEDVAGAPKPVLVLLAPEASTPQLRARLEYEYGGARVRRGGPSALVHGERMWRVLRDAPAESRAEAQFTEAGGRLLAAEREGVDGTLDRRRLGALVRALAQQGWLVQGEGLKLRTQSQLALSVRSNIDWFEVEAQIDFDGVALELPALLDALARKQPLVRLSDGSYGLVPEDWLAKWESLGALGKLQDGALRVDRSRGFLLDALLAERAEVQGDAGFEELRRRLARAKEPAPAREPEGFAGELRPYQRAGLGWLAFLGELGLGGCLADDMGLGKTVQVLALIARRKPRARGPTLVVAPKSLLFNWEREAQRFAPGLAVHVHHGLGRARSGAPLEDADLVVTTYATLRGDVHLLGGVRFDMVVLDEAQAIKNARSQSAKAARVLQADLRLALTGTPVENRIEDLLSIFEFLNPGLLEGSRVLRRLLEGGDELETARLAARALGPFLLRRTKEEVLTELPQKTEQLVSCELEGAQRREYDALRAHYRRTLLTRVDEVGMAKAGINVLEALLRLRQAACHLALLDAQHAGTRSAKLETLLEMLEELRDSGHKALVFSQFTSFLALIQPELDQRGLAHEYLDGKTRDRQERIDRFQGDPAKHVFLISLKAGGVGLNLTAADYVFLLDPWWNPAVERQAIDRTHRIGQTRPVTAYRLVARDTVEEKVLALQERKRAVADALFEGAGSALRELTRADLEAILS